MAASDPGRPSLAIRSLGIAGMLGGLGLLAAFVFDIPGALNTIRIVLFCGGALSAGVALFGPHAAASRRLALAATVPLVAANGLYIAWVLVAVGRERPFAGDFGLLGFWAGLALWLAGAWFGVVALRLGVAWRPAALILAVGSLMAITGIDRLRLTSEASPTIFALEAWAASRMQPSSITSCHVAHPPVRSPTGSADTGAARSEGQLLTAVCAWLQSAGMMR